MNFYLTLLLAALVWLAPTGPALAQGADVSDALLLVASPLVRDPSYARTVILAVPVENNRHVGVIINRPTRRSLASLFPEHAPSKKVIEPVFFGGPMSSSAVFAVVRSSGNPGRGSIELTKDLFLAITANTVDHVIESTPNQARYYVGNTLWRPGELRAEIDRRIWYVMNADTDLVFRKDSDRLWEELSRLARAITAETRGRVVAALP